MTHCHTFIDALRRTGYRITPQREMIIGALAHAERHMTAEEIFATVQNQTRSLNIATVYRTLLLLVERGLATRLDLGGGQVVYATNHHGPHAHLVCRGCGQVISADHQLIAALSEQLSRQYGFSADLQHLTFSGLCAECRKKI